jgi:transposase
VRTILKRLGYRWRRVRRSVRSQRDPEAFDQAHRELLALRKRERRGQIDLYYGDEAGFSLEPAVPYAWQKPDTPLCCPSGSHHQRQNVLGLLSCHGGFTSYITSGTITSEVVVACINAFVKRLRRRKQQRPVVIVLDNAPVHRTPLFEEYRARWRKRDVTIKFLPSYSPELNMIEILWKRMKYSWLPITAYTCWESLTDAVEHILKNVGRLYQITFS